jgi:hypothetical protein
MKGSGAGAGVSDTEDSKSEVILEDEILATNPRDLEPIELDDPSIPVEQTFKKSVQLIRASSAESAPETIHSDGEPMSPPLPTHDESPRGQPTSPKAGLMLKINAVAANNDDDAAEILIEKKKQPSPLKLTVASLSGQESTTSAEDVNLIAIPSPRFKADSLSFSPGARAAAAAAEAARLNQAAQASLPSPTFKESESKAFHEVKKGGVPAHHMLRFDSDTVETAEVSVVVGVLNKTDSSPVPSLNATLDSSFDQKETKPKKGGKAVQFQFDDAAMAEAEKREKMSKPQKSILKKLASPRTKVRVQKKEEEIMLTIRTLAVGSVMVKYSTKYGLF